MSKEQKDQMDRLLGEFCETVTKTLGKNVETVHISTRGNINLVTRKPNSTGMEGPTTRAGV